MMTLLDWLYRKIAEWHLLIFYGIGDQDPVSFLVEVALGILLFVVILRVVMSVLAMLNPPSAPAQPAIYVQAQPAPTPQASRSGCGCRFILGVILASILMLVFGTIASVVFVSAAV